MTIMELPKALVAVVFLGVCLPIVGRHLFLGRSILLGLAVPQLSMAGIAFVFLGTGLGWTWTSWFADDSSRAAVGALVFSIPTLGVLGRSGVNGKAPSGAWLAVAYLAANAATNLMLSSNAVGETYLADLFHGRLILISDAALGWLIGVLSLVTVLGLLFRKWLLLVLIDPDFATVTNIRTSSWGLCLALLNGSAIGVSVAAVGPLVTFGFLVLPVLGASLLANSLRGHLMLAMCIGIVTGGVGYNLAYRWDLPLGDVTVAVGVGVLLVCLFAKRARETSQKGSATS